MNKIYINFGVHGPLNYKHVIRTNHMANWPPNQQIKFYNMLRTLLQLQCT